MPILSELGLTAGFMLHHTAVRETPAMARDHLVMRGRPAARISAGQRRSGPSGSQIASRSLPLWLGKY